MFIKKWSWQLSSKQQRIRIKVIGKTGFFIADAIIDTGSDCCAFPKHVFNMIFENDKTENAITIRGVGETKAVSRRVSIELFSDDGTIIQKLTNVEAWFLLDENFKVSLFGVSNAMDKFKWVLDYPAGKMTLS